MNVEPGSGNGNHGIVTHTAVVPPASASALALSSSSFFLSLSFFLCLPLFLCIYLSIPRRRRSYSSSSSNQLSRAGAI